MNMPSVCSLVYIPFSQNVWPHFWEGVGGVKLREEGVHGIQKVMRGVSDTKKVKEHQSKA
jgi:hypothetical protein